MDDPIPNQNFTVVNRQSNISPNLRLLQHSKSVDSLTSSSVGHPEFTDDQQMLYTRHATNRTHTQASLRLIIIPDNETTRFYLQYTNEHDSVRMSTSRHSVQPQLITPQLYQNYALREAPVYVRRQGEEEVYYENLAQYLSTKKPDLSSRTVRRMLKFSSRDEYFAYLRKKISTIKAKQLVQESEGSSSEPSSRYKTIKTTLPDEERLRSPAGYYNVQNGTTISESNMYENEQQQDDRYNFSSSSRSPQTTNSTGGQSLTTPDKNVTLPRNTTLSGQSNEGESESRATVSRSASAAAAKASTIKSTTSSSAGSSREHPAVSSSVVRAQSLVSPTRASGTKGGEDSVKKEKKSKFRTPSFLRKRKEKKKLLIKKKRKMNNRTFLVII